MDDPKLQLPSMFRYPHVDQAARVTHEQRLPAISSRKLYLLD